jgi:hypothetical protein
VPNAGEFVDAADINALQTFYAIKGADESVTSSTALQNDDDLSADLAIGIWLVEAHLYHTGAAAGDIQTAWTTTGTITCLSRGVIAPSGAATDVTGAASAIRIQALSFTLTVGARFGTDGTNTGHSVERLILDVDAAGTLQLQWAQFSSNGTATTLKAGSHLVWKQLTAG